MNHYLSAEVAAPPRTLLPELVEEDFSAVTRMVQTYAAATALFTLRELRDHLEEQDVQLPETLREWRGLFAEMQETITEQPDDDAKPPHRWISESINRATYYSLVVDQTPNENVGRAAPTPDAASSIVGQTAQATSKAERPVQDAAHEYDVVSALFTALFAKSGLPYMRQKHLIAATADYVNTTPEEAKRIVNAARQAGMLATQRLGGHTMVGPAQTEGESMDGMARTGPTEIAKSERALTEVEFSTAIEIVERLVDKKAQYITTIDTVKSLEQTLKTDLTGPQFRKLLRMLQSLDVLVVENSSQYRKARRSPKVLLDDRFNRQFWAEHAGEYQEKLSAVRLSR
jgi:hypothetical protein